MTYTPGWPEIAPTSRTFEAGDWPVRKFQSEDGVEVRILRGDRRRNHKLRLSYANIPDAIAEQFLDFYYSRQGTYQTMYLPRPLTNHLGAGWGGTTEAFNPGPATRWRFEGPPSIESIYPGVSSVSFTLIAVGVVS